MNTLRGMTTWHITSFLAMAIATSAYAHHSTKVTYDDSKTVEIKGVLVDFQLKSPHSLLTVEATNPDGSKKRWDIESGSLAQLRRQGWQDDTLKRGDVITVLAYPNRRPDVPLIYGRTYTRSDGTVIGGGQAARNAAPQAAPAVTGTGIQRFAGRWRPRPFRGEKPADGSPLPLSAAGVKAWKAYDQASSPANTCEPVNLPAIHYAPYLYDIRVNAANVVFKHEVYEVTRTIPRTSAPARVDSTGLFGQAFVRVEGDALVVESSGYPASKWGLGITTLHLGNGADVPSSNRKRLVERYTLSADGQTLRIDYTLEDPTYLSKPYASYVEFSRVPDSTPMYEYKCDRESAARFSRKPS